jgi:glycerol-3-phosphate responsive antiterminator
MASFEVQITAEKDGQTQWVCEGYKARDTIAAKAKAIKQAEKQGFRNIRNVNVYPASSTAGLVF